MSQQTDTAPSLSPASLAAHHLPAALTGRVFGRLTVLSEFKKKTGSRKVQSRWYCHCLCRCGKEVDVLSSNLTKSGRGCTRSCGCLRLERNKKHGATGTTAYVAWHSLKAALTQEGSFAFRTHGGAGFKLDEGWEADFRKFLADMGEPPPGRTKIRRHDPMGHFVPGNCYWAEPASRRRFHDEDLRGRVFGRLKLIEPEPEAPQGQRFWRVRCECGIQKSVRLMSLLKGQTRSCGCLAAERITPPDQRKPPASQTRVYGVWRTLIERCCRPEDPQYRRFGAKGVKLHPPWQDFETFRADLGECPPDHAFMRRDETGDFVPGNCFWAPLSSLRRTQSGYRLIESGH